MVSLRSCRVVFDVALIGPPSWLGNRLEQIEGEIISPSRPEFVGEYDGGKDHNQRRHRENVVWFHNSISPVCSMLRIINDSKGG
jgi:hypothetical protein